jgi:hypothetical protein
MMSFESFVQSGYTAYSLTTSSRADLLRHFPAKYSDIICHHVTFKFPAKSTDALPPAVRDAHVVGYEDSGDGIEALVVEINGSTKRPDGKIFHITLSLSREAGKKPVHSNALLAKGFKSVTPFTIHLQPTFLQ